MENTFLDIFNDLLNENELTRKAFATKSGIPYPTVIGWTNLGRLPDFLALNKIANFFNCSVDYLMGREKDYGNPITSTILSAKEEKLLSDFRALSLENRELVQKITTKLK